MTRTILGALLMTLVFTPILRAGNLAAQTNCPIDGMAISKAYFVDEAGQRIYACSTQCVAKITADPKAAVAALTAKGEQPAQLQTMCPNMENKKIRKTRFVDYEGKRIYVCCNDCVRAVTKDPAKYLKKLEDKGIVVEQYQTHCPINVTENIDKKAFVDFGGKRIYLCCNDCKAKVAADPAKYITELEAEGVTLDKTPTAP